MAKIVVALLNSGKRSAQSSSVSEKRVRDSEGRITTLRTVDAGSASFGHDLQYVFEKNVAKARRDNKRVIGKTDVAVAKR